MDLKDNLRELHMKKVLAFLLAAGMVFTLPACDFVGTSPLLQ